ncbi:MULTISPECIES: PilN domain-containing protein [unclassified Legionella]|uniref:PilN domain-containing protein n=1 Tax=unclassified Legionella TaxID=2622702 RepID=UPI00105420AF|nr:MULTISPECIES: PilN domain-containing protein [unclassified Legionella]MDI9817711.1 PilN domain-containing protein [Legionella sp. PL877]
MSAINLLPWREQRKTRIKRNLGYFIIFSFSLTVILDCYVNYQLNGLSKYNQKLERESIKTDINLKELEKLINIRNSLIYRLETLIEIQKKSVFIVRFFDILIGITPPELTLKKIEIINGILTVDGYSGKEDFIGLFVNEIGKIEWVSKSSIVEVNSNDFWCFSFRIVAKINFK